VPFHVHHPAARAWFESVALTEALFSRITMLGLLRLLTNPVVMNEHPLGSVAAWQLYAERRQLPTLLRDGLATPYSELVEEPSA